MVVLVGFLSLTSTQPGYGQGLDPFAVAASQATETLQRAIDAGVVGSAIGLIARGDQILVLYSGGEIGSGEPMPLNAIAGIASIQKPITAAAVRMLYERGQLDLQASVDGWFPGFSDRVITTSGDTVESARRPTVFELLTHQAGLIPEGPELEALWDATTNQEFARRIGAGTAYPAAEYGWGLGVLVRVDAASGGGAGRGSFGWNGGTGTRFQVDPESGMIAIVFLPTWPTH